MRAGAAEQAGPTPWRTCSAARAEDPVPADRRSARRLCAAPSRQARDRRPRSGKVDRLRRARAGGDRHRGSTQGERRAQRLPCAAAVRRDAREAAHLARDLAARRRRRAAQYRAQRHVHCRAGGGGRSRAHPGAQGARRRCLAGRQAVRPLRQLHGEPGRCRSGRRLVPHDAARHRARKPAGAQRGGRPRLHLLTSAPPAGRRSWSTITAPTGSTASRRWSASGSPRTTARWSTARSAGTRRRCSA